MALINCKFYGSMVGCKNGVECRFSHSNPNSVPFCAFHPKTCKYGIKCRRRHIDYKINEHGFVEYEPQSSYKQWLRDRNPFDAKLKTSDIDINQQYYKLPGIKRATKTNDKLCVYAYIHKLQQALGHDIIIPYSLYDLCYLFYHIPRPHRILFHRFRDKYSASVRELPQEQQFGLFNVEISSLSTLINLNKFIYLKK